MRLSVIAVLASACAWSASQSLSPPKKVSLLANTKKRAALRLAHRPRHLRLTSRIPVLSAPADMLIARRGQTLYASDNQRGLIRIIDLSLRRVRSTLQVPPEPFRMAMTRDGSKIYVGHAVGQALTVIDTVNEAFKTLHLPARADTPVLTSDERYVYLPACSAGLQRLDTETGQVVTIRPGRCPVSAVLSPDGQYLWVSYQGGGPGGSPGHDAIAHYDARSGKLLASITGLPHVGGYLAISPDGTRLFANGHDACSNPAYDHVGCRVVPSSFIHVIDTAKRRATNDIVFAGNFNMGMMVVSPNGRLLVVGGPKLLLFDAATLTLLESQADELSYGALAFSPDGAILYIGLPEAVLGIYSVDDRI